jgi:hypothetical protein
MHSQEFSYSRSEHADFRAALARASQPQQSSLHEQAGKTSSVRSFEEYDPYHNRNISNIVSKITDEGPANLHQKKRKNQKQSGFRRAKVDNLQLAEDTYTPSVPRQTNHEQPPPQPFTFNEAESGEETKPAGLAGNSIWYQSVLVLLIAVIAVIGFLLYQLTLKADELSQALRVKEEQVFITKESLELPADEMLPRLNSLGETLSELKQELHEIKLDQKKAFQHQDKKGPLKSVPMVMPVPMNNDRVATLKNDFKLIRNGIRDSGVSHVARQDPGQLKTQPVSKNKIKTDKKDFVPNKLVVNLVSLTNRDKAQAAYDLLIQSGVSPLIEEVVVNDRKVYRLSVDGFDSRESAKDFISKVGEKYGFEGGWIRQN